MNQEGPFTIPAINNYIPEKLKPFIIILFVILFQFSGGIYLASLNQMVGETQLLPHDIMMAGFASLVGMSLFFTIMLRFKMRFTTKFSFIVCAVGLIIANVICLYTKSLPVLIAVCFLVGILKMWATFECNSTIQLWITQKRDMAIFFCYIYILVQGVIQLSGSTTIYLEYFFGWEYMHWFVIGALLFIILATLLIFNANRFMPPFPLFGIDWLGALLWGIICLSINFICLYGDHFDWFMSDEIPIACGVLLIALGSNLYRASFIRHPFIPLKTFLYKPVWITIVLYLIVDLFIAPAHLIEHIYFHNILKHDSLHTLEFHTISWFAVFCAALFTYHFFALARRTFVSAFILGFIPIVGYLISMYFFIDHNTSDEMLYIPIFLRNFGYVICSIVLLTNLIKTPFQNFFSAFSIQMFISAACGAAICSAILGVMFKQVAAKNFMLMSTNLDLVNPILSQLDQQKIGDILGQQILMVSFKEIFGLLLILSIISLGIFVIYWNFLSLHTRPFDFSGPPPKKGDVQ